MKQRIRKQYGFTLAELLVVVAVIAVLIGVAIPTLDNQLEKSRQMTDAANLRGAFAAARIAEINGTVTVNGYKIRIANKADDLKSGDDAYTLVFWCDTDTGMLYPSYYTLPDGTNVSAITGEPGAVEAKPESDNTLGVIASEESCTTRLMARGTRLIPDHGALPFATHEYIRYRDRETAIAEQGNTPNLVYELVGYMDSRVNHMRIRVEYEWSADMGGYTLKEIRFADITSANERQTG